MLTFRHYSSSDLQACLNAFENNIPDFFLQEELKDFVTKITHDFYGKGMHGYDMELGTKVTLAH